jgi:hypothetical protein
VLSTDAVTTGSSGPKQQASDPPADADRRTRVLSAVCRGVAEQPELLAECRAKSGM